MGKAVQILKKSDDASAVHNTVGIYFMNRTTTESLSYCLSGPIANKTNFRHNTYLHLTVSASQYL